MEVKTIGLDLAKNIFQVHGVDAAGEVSVTKRLRRSQMLEFFAGLKPCLVGIEACPTAHYWGRELKSLGHDVRLIPPQYVKPYVRRSKNDAADAAAICEAVARPSMRFVPLKDETQQAALMLHRVRDLLVRQRVQLISAIRAHAAEFGVIEAKGPQNIVRLLASLEAGSVPDLARQLIGVLTEQLDAVEEQIAEVDRRIVSWHKCNETSRRLAGVPGIGIMTATAIAATVPDPSVFRGGREFAAWLGLVPRQNSSGGKARLGKISKQGNEHVRRLLIIGAQAALLCSKEVKATAWVQGMMARRPRMVVVVALANKMARIAWALMARRTQYGVAVAA
jgi:transposase